MKVDTLIKNARLASASHPEGIRAAVAINGERIIAVYTPETAEFAQEYNSYPFNISTLHQLPEARNVVDAHGKWLLPGAIDCHVHFRQPGLTHKADIASESRAAVLGGVTSFIDMPNTKPPTLSRADVETKTEIAASVSAANYAFFIGASTDNLHILLHADYHTIAGVKVFLGSSTGNMLVDDERLLCDIFSQVDALIAVHAENQAIIDQNTARIKAQYAPGQAPISLHPEIRSAEACYRCTAEAIERATHYGTRLHVTHLSTSLETKLFDSGNPDSKRITAEVSPHHLWFSDADYIRLGARIKMNPAVKTADDRDALRSALLARRIDMVATDHAPHLLSEKEGDVFTAVSGAPLVQFSMPLMLNMFPPQIVAEKMALNPALTYRIKDRGRIAPGYFADLVLVEHLSEPYTVTDADAASKCAWTPLAGTQLSHRVTHTWVNGTLTVCDGRLTDLSTPPAKPLYFN